MMSQSTSITGQGKTTRKALTQERYKELREVSKSENVEMRNVLKEKTEILHSSSKMRGTFL